MHVAARCAGLALFAVLLGAATPAPPNPPLVLYNPNGGIDTASTATLSLGTAAPGAVATANCGSSLANPCGGLDPKALAILNNPLGHDFQYGVNGSVTAGVSNHGNLVGGSVTAWLQKDDLAMSLTLSGAQLSGGPRYYAVPVSHP
jgi:hypothetical protein